MALKDLKSCYKEGYLYVHLYIDAKQGLRIVRKWDERREMAKQVHKVNFAYEKY